MSIRRGLTSAIGFRLFFLYLFTVLGGCGGDGSGAVDTAANKIVIVLLDRSGSVRDDRAIYDRALSVVRRSLREGDRFVMGSITSASGTDFSASIDYVLPLPLKKQSWLDEPIKYRREKEEHEKQLAETLADLDREIQMLMQTSSDTARTTICESLGVVEPIFHSERRRKILVILSDMVEDSGVANFDRRFLSLEEIRGIIEHQRAAGTLPDLAGVRIYVAGALASPPERSAAIKRFWTEYFAAAGAILGNGNYGRVLGPFEE